MTGLDGLDQDQVRAFADAVDALGPLGAPAGFQATQVTRCWGRWLAFTQPWFAGPRTEWRGLQLDARTTWEVIGVDRLATGSAALPARSSVVHPVAPVDQHALEELDELDHAGIGDHDADGHLGPGVHALVFTPSTAGVTLGEVLDASATQRARLDPAVAAHIIAAVAPDFLEEESTARARAVGVDQVLIGFDGEVLSRAHLPWWGARRRARLPLGYMTPTTEATTRRLLGEVLYELFTSRRMPLSGEPVNLSFPGMEKRLRDPLRSLTQQLLEGSIAADVADLWERDLLLSSTKSVLERVAMLPVLAGTVDATLIAGIVRGVFPERWEREQRIRRIIEDHL